MYACEHWQECVILLFQTEFVDLRVKHLITSADKGVMTMGRNK